jgi:hypothetical protein
VFCPVFTGTVTLWWPPKSSEFGAILWLLTVACDHEASRCAGDQWVFAGLAKWPRPLDVGSPGRTLGRLSCHKIPEQLDRIGTKSAGNLNKFNNVDAALAPFVFGDERLRPAQLFGQCLLSNARGMSHCDKGGDQPGIFGGFEGLLHVPPGLRIGGVQFDPEIGLSQNGIILTPICHLEGPSEPALDFGPKGSALAVWSLASSQHAG